MHHEKDSDTEPATLLPSVAEATALLAKEDGLPEATGIALAFAKGSGAPAHFSAALRDFITGPARISQAACPVALSSAQVEATFMEGRHGWVVPLANYTGAPLQQISVTIRAGRPFGEVRS